MNKTHNRKKIATAAMAGLGITMILGGAFAFMFDDLTHTQPVTVEWVEIVDGSSTIQIEDPSAPGVAVTEMTPGITYNVTGTIQNDSTVETNWIASATGATGIDISIADPDGSDTNVAPGAEVNVAEFGITIDVQQYVAVPSEPTDISFTFDATDARPVQP